MNHGNIRFFSIGGTGNYFGGGGDGVARLEILTGTVSCSRNKTTYIPIAIPFEKYELRALHIENRGNDNPINVKLAEIEDINKVRYVSLNKKVIEDILLYPFYDSDGTGNLHMWIENSFSTDCNVNYEIRITNLL